MFCGQHRRFRSPACGGTAPAALIAPANPTKAAVRIALMTVPAPSAAWLTPVDPWTPRRPGITTPYRQAVRMVWLDLRRTCSAPGQAPTPRPARPLRSPDQTLAIGVAHAAPVTPFIKPAIGPLSGFPDVSFSCPGWRGCYSASTGAVCACGRCIRADGRPNPAGGYGRRAS